MRTMKSAVLLLLLLHCLCGAGLPLFQLSSKADEALRLALDQINAQHARARLYRVARASIKRVIPLGGNTYDLLLKFGVRETECVTGSGVDPQECAYRHGYLVSEASCRSRVRVSDEVTKLLTLKCEIMDSSSSSSSSEEMGKGRFYNPNFTVEKGTASVDPTTAPNLHITPPLFPGHRGPEIRGDNFSNHLE